MKIKYGKFLFKL